MSKTELNNGIVEKDFDFIHWEKDSGGPESFELMIYCKSKIDADDKKQQILNNQAIVDEIKRVQKYAMNYRDITIDSICKQILQTTHHSKGISQS